MKSVDFTGFYTIDLCANSHPLKRAKETKLPPYYIFDNKELDKLVELTPKTLEELKQSKILTEIKIKMHGQAIINEIKND